MRYKLFCKQRGILVERFKNKSNIRDFLISYHSIDNDLDELKALNLKQLLEIFDWEIEKWLT